jgi:hypothetical protein
MDLSLFDKLAGDEEKFLSSLFLAPVLRHRPVRIRIAGVVLSLKVNRKHYEGWAVCRPESFNVASFVRDASMEERHTYLNLFRPRRLVLCHKEGRVWFGVPAGNEQGLYPVALTREVQPFDTVVARYDGATLWFDDQDQRANPRTAPYLREALAELKEPDKLELPGLTRPERDAYSLAYGTALAADKEAKRDREGERVKEAVERAGGTFRGYVDRGEVFTVEYLVNGSPHRSTVRRHDLGVESAGICLSGADRAYDLQSLVAVVSEGERNRRIVRVGEGGIMTQEGYQNMYGGGAREDEDDW